MSLDKQKSYLNIDNYGIAITTMDEVFLEVAKDVERRKAEAEGYELPPSSESDEDDYLDEEPVLVKPVKKPLNDKRRRRSSVFRKNFKRAETVR